MLEEMTNPDLIEHVFEDPESSAAAHELANRLQCAIEELERLTVVIRRLEAPDGADPRSEG